MQTTIRIHYPANPGSIELHTSPTWERKLQPIKVFNDGQTFEFGISGVDALSFEFKPVLRRKGQELWAVGHNYRILTGTERDVHPFFLEDSNGDLTELTVAGRRVTVYTPPGYHENPLKAYPVLYMQDGQNLFNPGAFGEWQVDETLDSLHRWSSVQKTLVVGIHHGDRFKEFSDPGWRDYRDLVVDQIKPAIEKKFRVISDRDHTAIMGSSLGGLAALFLAWDRPDVFSKVACFSGAFPDFGRPFAELLMRKPKPDVFVYLDSGMAGIQNDGFDSTREIRDLLILRGFKMGSDLIYYSFPEHKHNEQAWATRFSIPLQHFFGN